MRLLLLSAYHSASHRYWCEGLMAALPEFDWTLKTQPARHFSWRVRASGWLWALADDADLSRKYDLVIATSLCEVVTLKALCPALRDTPLWLYFHENQFAHPIGDRQWASHQQGWQFQSIQNALCADRIDFNTAFNRDTFFAGARRLLKKFPERLPNRPLQRLEAHSGVLAVPLTERFAQFRDAPKNRRLIVWNHRWEWDKQPERFLKALTELAAEGIDFEVAMLGSGSGRKTGEFQEYRDALGPRVRHWGEAHEATYSAFIREAGIGVSCALHDFQGLATLELAQAGATVVVPRRVAYPECLPDAHFYEGSEADAATDSSDLKNALRGVLKDESPPAIDPEKLPRWSTLAEAYRERIKQLIQ
jgi:glycosyltransferase involved in cell wall biosynthesis